MQYYLYDLFPGISFLKIFWAWQHAHYPIFSAVEREIYHPFYLIAISIILNDYGTCYKIMDSPFPAVGQQHEEFTPKPNIAWPTIHAKDK